MNETEVRQRFERGVRDKQNLGRVLDLPNLVRPHEIDLRETDEVAQSILKLDSRHQARMACISEHTDVVRQIVAYEYLRNLRGVPTGCRAFAVRVTALLGHDRLE